MPRTCAADQGPLTVFMIAKWRIACEKSVICKAVPVPELLGRKVECTHAWKMHIEIRVVAFISKIVLYLVAELGTLQVPWWPVRLAPNLFGCGPAGGSLFLTKMAIT